MVILPAVRFPLWQKNPKLRVMRPIDPIITIGKRDPVRTVPNKAAAII